MSTYDLEEQERIAALKDWWDKWGNTVLGAAVASLLAVAGVWGYKEYQKKQNAQAEVLFASVQKAAQEAAASKDGKKLSSAADALAKEYPGSFFATEGELMAAHTAGDAKDWAAAETHLRWVIDNGRDLYKNIARLRLAGVMLETKKYDEGLKAISDIKEEGFASAAADMKGDIYAAQGRNDEARAAYEVAVEKAGPRSALKGLSQAKLDAYGGPTKKEEPKKDDAKKDGAAK